MAPVARLLVAVAALLVAGDGAAQNLGAPVQAVLSEEPAWLSRWSPLQRVGDLPRRFPGEHMGDIRLLSAPAPRVGLLWTAGNPAGLPRDVAGRYAHVSAGLGETSGDYRRPLDPGQITRTGAAAQGWTAVERGAVIGEVAVERVHMTSPRFGLLVEPYGSIPLTWADTLASDAGSTGTRLVGAGGWGIGPLAFGLGLGFEGSEVRTLAASVPSLLRVSTAGVSGGVAVVLGKTGIHLAAVGKWHAVTQTLLVSPRASSTRLVAFSGLREPTIIDIEQSTFGRRFERRSRALGASLDGTHGAVQWILGAQAEETTEDHFAFAAFDPPRDAWQADGWSGFAAAQVRVGSGTWAAFQTRYATLAGDVRLADREISHFFTDEYALGFDVELRHQTGPWTGAVHAGTRREHRRRRDDLARVTAQVDQWEPWIAVEVARALPLALDAALGGSLMQYAPWGAIPDESHLGPRYRRYLASELALLASEALVAAGTFTLRWRASGGTAVWAALSARSVSPSGRPIGRLPSLPSGERSVRRLEVGVTLR